jgi:hypothetical protein
MNVNDFITSAEKVYAEDIALSRIIDKVNPEKMTVVNKDLVGLPLSVGIYNEETGEVVIEESVVVDPEDPGKEEE